MPSTCKTEGILAISREQRNKIILNGVGSENENQRHIFARLKRRFESNRLVAMVLKHIRQDRQHAETNIELYADDWAFHRGPITQENFKEFASDCVDRALSLHQAKQQQREASEERELSGSLMDGFNDGGFGDLPGDEEFRKQLEKDSR